METLSNPREGDVSLFSGLLVAAEEEEVEAQHYRNAPPTPHHCPYQVSCRYRWMSRQLGREGGDGMD